MADNPAVVSRAPHSIYCECPRAYHLQLHTYACLRARRGERTIDQYYGPPAPANYGRSGK